MRTYLTVILSVFTLLGCASAPNPAASSSPGLVTVRSIYDVEQTTQRFQAELERAGMKQFGLIDHAAGAESVGLSLPPTRVVIFGNPKIGTPLMRCATTVAIDLPMKALIYQDADGGVWFAYNDPGYLNTRHKISGCDEVLQRVSKALAKFAAIATQT